MEIARLSLAEGAAAARGIAVVIDVFRAFTCEPLLYACGAKRIVLEGDIGRCLAWKERRGRLQAPSSSASTTSVPSTAST